MSNQAANPSAMEAAATWLLRLREDTLSDAEMSQWIEWCEANPENLRTFEELQSLWRLAGEHPPAPQMTAHLLRGDGPSGRRFSVLPFRGRQRSWTWAVAVPAVLALAVACGWFVARTGPWTAENKVSLEKIAAVDSVKTPAAQNRQGLLPDGSHVDLGARTVLDVDFSDVRRQLELRDGQAFFQVMQDKSRPFVVSVGEIQIVALGTAFDVRRTAAQVAVTVQEGTVKMIRGGDALTATAGYQLIFTPASGKVRKSLVDPAMALAWRSGRLEFTGDPLDVVIASVNRYSRQPILLGDVALGKLTFTGTVFTDSIDASLDAMEQVFPIRIRRTSTEIVFTSR